MRVAWVCNKAPKPVVEASGINDGHYGGWLDSTSRDLLEMPHVEMLVLFRSQSNASGATGNLSYAAFGEGASSDWFQSKFREFNPDVIHIWGTEFPHSLEAIRASNDIGLEDSTVVSIQGLVSIYGTYHYNEGLSDLVMRKPSFGDIVRRTSLNKERRSFIARGELERECLRLARHVIGRTDWDKACVCQVNPAVTYHYCNESLREEFYSGEWNVTHMERHSLFVSQCSYPIKGFHYVLDALALLRPEFPDVKLYTTGESVFRKSLYRNLGRNSYQVYIAKKIKKLGLEDNVRFLGSLDALAMREQYLRANVFVSASTIENSPNSVGEAMLLGCPVVSSYVGGVPNMIDHGVEGLLYQSSAPYMLAWYLRELFNDDELAKRISSCARERAKETHSREKNLADLLKKYELIARR